MPSQALRAPPFWSAYWNGMYATPRAWAHKGANLVHAFEAVAAATVPRSLHHNLVDQALMLAGMAIEVQLKAIFVSDSKSRLVITRTKGPFNAQEKVLRDRFFSHRLVDLFDLTDIALNDAQRHAAVGITQFVYWRGRYVVPTDRGITDLVPTEQPDGSIGSPHQVSIDTARELVSYVISQVNQRLYGEV